MKAVTQSELETPVQSLLKRICSRRCKTKGKCLLLLQMKTWSLRQSCRHKSGVLWLKACHLCNQVTGIRVLTLNNRNGQDQVTSRFIPKTVETFRQGLKAWSLTSQPRATWLETQIILKEIFTSISCLVSTITSRAFTKTSTTKAESTKHFTSVPRLLGSKTWRRPNSTEEAQSTKCRTGFQKDTPIQIIKGECSPVIQAGCRVQ